MSVTLLLVVVTALISYSAFQRPDLRLRLMHAPYLENQRKEYYRFLTAGFVHGNWLHLIINMFVFYDFGQLVETQFTYYFGDLLGRINFLMLYLLGISFANMPTFFKHRHNASFASVGASGAVSAILFAYIIFNPWSTLLLFFILPVPAILAAVLYLVYSSWAGRQSRDHIDHDAHFYGAVFGFLFTVAIKPAFFALFIRRLVEGFPF